MYSPELQVRIAQLRAKIAEGQTLTPEEQREIIVALRGERKAIAMPTAGSATTKARKAAAAKPDGEALLNDLFGGV